MKILLLTYYFPPDPNISGRRWAKLAKYLNQEGHTIKVLASQPNKGENSPWDNDINILDIEYFKRSYPRILDENPKNILEKVKYKLAVKKLSKKIKGTIYDRAALIQDAVIKNVKNELSKKEYDVLIVNGPPHRMMYYATLIKRDFPNLFLVSDFRDPWTWWYNYGYPYLNEENKLFEEAMEREVVLNSNLILAPDENMLLHLRNKYGNFNSLHLPHGYDAADFPSKKWSPIGEGEKLKLVYFGNLYDDQQHIFKSIADSISSNKNVYLDIYSTTTNYKENFDTFNLENRVQYLSTLKSADLFSKLLQYDALLMPIPEKFKDIFSSKFYEIIFSGIPIIYIGDEGEVSKFIQSNKLGICITEDYTKLLNDIFKGKIEIYIESNFNISSYSFAEQAKTLVDRINQDKNHI